MTQENKEQLLRDLCARLHCGVICQIYDPQQDYEEDIFDARLIQIDAWTSHCYFWGCSETDPYKIEQVKPYLRPMSSMTEEEKEELSHLLPKDWSVEIDKFNNFYFDMSPSIFMEIDVFLNIIDWLNAHHFDYRTTYDESHEKWVSMIEKGLAIEVTEENNPYKD